MRFGVLGQLSVWTTEGMSVRVPELKVRTLLASLLVEAGRPVSAHRLIDDLWGEEQPGNPLRALQAKVSQLRRVLDEAEPGARDLVATRAPGYVLAAPREAVDSAAFAALAARARASSDPGVRAALFAEALAVWRGPAFADFAEEPFTRAAANRLEEERLVVREEHAEARLERGEHALLVGELAELVERHPLRERLRAVQLSALYRAGRQSEALAGYEELRTRLADDLGLDPSPALVALQRAILTQDPRLEAPPTAEPEPAPPTDPAKATARTNLPAALSALVGRDEAVAAVRELAATRRLVTLTGPGGVGKTRLAVESATGLTGMFPDGVWLVELAGSKGEVAEAAAAALGIRDDAVWGTPSAAQRPGSAERLAGAVRERELLLVLDNCEHVVDEVAALAEILLRTAPGLRILTTSQEPLALAGETLWNVPALELGAAVELFTSRAAATAPGFALTDGNRETVEAVCRRLDGIPLALELAATRVRALGVERLLERLDDRFRLLASGQRGAPARQQTLRAVIDWSWHLLTAPEQAVLRRLAVHAEGCTLEAAEEVCAGDGVDPADVLDLLVRLVDRSLVAPAPGPAGPRYRLLESVAAYCAERLDEAGESRAVRARHLAHHLDLAERGAPRLRTAAQRTWLERLDAEGANQRAALDHALDHALATGDGTAALRLVCALAWYWVLRGRLGEGERSLRAALAAPGGAPAELCARAAVWHTGFAVLAGEGAGRTTRIRTALDAYEECGDRGGLAWARWFLAHALSVTGDPVNGQGLTERALEGFLALDDRWGTAAALADRSVQLLLGGALAGAARDGARSAELFRETGDGAARLWTVYPLASLAEIHGDYTEAARLQREGLETAESLGLTTQAADLLSGLGRSALLTGDLDVARDLHERSRRKAAEQGFTAGEINAELGLGLGARRAGDLPAAERHMRRVLDWHRSVGLDGANALILAELGHIAQLGGDTEGALALQEQGLAIARTTGDPRALALALEGLAGALAPAGRPAAAAALLGAADAARRSTGAPLPPAERADVDRTTAAAREDLGGERFAVEFTRGSAMPADTAYERLTDGL
ncbi:BTAD domain-containing putative transcriptional regulator [Streptomyces sp. NPDC059874]|uniref:BTAD domain-containing putative transcriptional regulator n=1 Tax=Streptomyces sp. NPDC059874 TaxID=3346983 RepID=UPI00366A14D3